MRSRYMFRNEPIVTAQPFPLCLSFTAVGGFQTSKLWHNLKGDSLNRADCIIAWLGIWLAPPLLSREPMTLLRRRARPLTRPN